MRLLRLLPVVLLLVAAGVHAQDKVTLRYKPALDAKWQEALTAEITEVLVQGQAAGLTGSASADVETKIVAVDKDTAKSTVQFALKNLKANLNGQAGTPSDPQPMKFVVDHLGKMALPEGAQTDLVSMVDTGGIPIQLVAMIAHAVRFPDQAVACGEDWSCEDTYDLPGMGQAPINTRWKLMKVEGNIATLAATAASVIPDFKIPNPMAPGTEMKVTGARLNITEMTIEYDLKDSFVKTNQATLKLDAKVDMGGFEMPFVMTMKLDLKPAEE